ncbi:09dc9103-2e4f-4484-b6d9-2a34349ee3c5 [Sclerotinia trifoliorum]|uniref:09dc9103-2e4f-4484-b6d9-2a34349ee3c5 n=1 Tax=Sclerotinia trifoliorum TaxID=28548 RepID=A0A8H2VTD2_9HELO|nr:09dc9103-2e4f-4484-b6d9-2a34349ee3c5 [Sclerotinia trifoliorum]
MTLCQYCSAIEFEMLRCPTTEELRSLITKSEVPDCYPFKSFIHNRQAPKFSLGPHTRIQQSSPTCAFCSAICDVVPDQIENPIRDLDSFKCVASMKSFARIVPMDGEAWDSDRDLMYLYRIGLSWYPIVSGEETDEPGIHRTTDAAPWYYIDDAFQTYNGEVCQDSNNNGSVDRNSTVFSGRIRPEIIDIKQPAQWLKECLDTHKECYQAKLGALQKAGSLTGCVPRTIQDAMRFSQQLGIKYLWVDALCIIQDSDSDKAIQIGTMGSIYAHSKVTLIAASGKNSEAGLPGIQTPRTGKQAQIDISTIDTRVSMKLIRTLHPHNNGYSFSHQLEDSEWSRRGWTLQERALSRRSIIFTDQQLLWACDAHDAFHAILEQVKQLTGDNFLWGIPTRRFELGLCWEPGSLRGVRRRKDLTTLETTSLKRKVSFPSWSWLGWHDAINIRVESRYRDLGMNPEIVCYILRNSPLRLVRVPGVSLDVPGAQTNIHPSQAQRTSPNFIELQDIPVHCLELSIDKLNDTPDDQLIFFRTEVAQFEHQHPEQIHPPHPQ